MERVNVFVLPMVDADGFDMASAGKQCTYDHAARPITSEIGSKFNARRPLPKPVAAVKKFLTTHSIDVAVSLESEGIFVRMPPDDAEAFAGRGDIRDESVTLLAQAYFNVGTTKSPIAMPTQLKLLLLITDRAGSPVVKSALSSSLQAHPIMSDVKAAGCVSSADHPAPFPSGLIYGSQLAGYAGTLLDFAYSELGTKTVAAHVSCCDFPSPEAVPQLWMQNLPPLVAFLRAASLGVYGKVTDLSGRPLTKAKIVLDGRSEIRVNDKDAR